MGKNEAQSKEDCPTPRVMLAAGPPKPVLIETQGEVREVETHRQGN